MTFIANIVSKVSRSSAGKSGNSKDKDKFIMNYLGQSVLSLVISESIFDLGEVKYTILWLLNIHLLDIYL